MPDEQPFPQTHWGSAEPSPLFQPVMKFASTPAGSRFIRALVPWDRRVMAATNGKYTLFGPTSLPGMLLTTTGRRSGQPRRSALSFLRDGDRLLVLGSNFGQERHPAWSSNLLANPDALAAIGGEEVPVTATLLTGDDRERGLQRFCEYPMYRAYVTRTSRELRIFALSRR
ncbi:nitroreductase family deazaflavin-dependent oxidoreductase [Mycolicibacterium komossense]|nr:nitroreductase family deazaflavin-dependent oxidoreductase [Mycolicibacterium komossense]